MAEERATSKMQAIDLAELTEATSERLRPTAEMEKIELLQLLWPAGYSPAVEDRTTAHVISRAPTLEPEVYDAEVFEADTKPMLYVITTPPDVRARWRMWQWLVRVCIVMTVALLAFIYLV